MSNSSRHANNKIGVFCRGPLENPGKNSKILPQKQTAAPKDGHFCLQLTEIAVNLSLAA
jgi:hypothetical protein